MGDCPRRFQLLHRYLTHHRWLTPLWSSPLYLNPPFGYLHQPPFWNGVLLVETPLPPTRLLPLLLSIEARFGRVRSFKNGPRTLDLDLLLHHRWHLSTPRLTLPHPGLSNRPSISLPILLPLYSHLHRKEYWLQLREKKESPQ